MVSGCRPAVLLSAADLRGRPDPLPAGPVTPTIDWPRGHEYDPCSLERAVPLGRYRARIGPLGTGFWRWPVS